MSQSVGMLSRSCGSLFRQCSRSILPACRQSLAFSTGSEIPNDGDVYDVVISGGGMVGTAMACALGCQQEDTVFSGRKILLLEAAPEKEKFSLTETYSNRVCALSNVTVELLDSFGAWDEILSMRVGPVKRMQVWDSCSDAMIAFNRQDAVENLAYIVENDVILEGINRQLSRCSDNVQVMYKTAANDYIFPESENDDLVTIELSNGKTIQTKLLIGADGFKSKSRECAKIKTVQWEYDQVGIVATLKFSEPSINNVAWQRFLPTGPIAMLPLSDTRSSLVWSTTKENVSELLKMPCDSFVDAVNHAYYDDSDKDSIAVGAGHLLDQLISSLVPKTGNISKQLPPTVVDIEEKSRAAFPLGLCHALHYVKPRFALIGDAAHRIHPLAGQGVNLGFSDVVCLRDILFKAAYDGADVGNVTHLLEYETLRQRHVLPVMATMDGLCRLYNNKFSPLVLLRTLGLQVTNLLEPVKDKIMESAMRGIKF